MKNAGRCARLLATLAFVATLMCACGSGSGGHSTPPPPAITVTLSTAPPSTLQVRLTASIAASVANDSANKGVTWSCTPAGSCGTFTPTTTASGASTVYQAPSAAGAVTIIATSVTNPVITATGAVTIDPVGTVSNLTGTYVLFATGWTAPWTPCGIAGSVTLDGNGNVTTGEMDYFDFGMHSSSEVSITGGSIVLGSDGRGTLTVNPNNPPPGMPTTFTFGITLVNNKHLLISEFDKYATSEGSMDFQTAPSSMPTGGNSFALLDWWRPMAFGGVLAVDPSTGNVTGGYGADAYGGSGGQWAFLGTGSRVGSPDAYGRGTISLLEVSAHQYTNANLNFAYYVVGPEAFRVIETDGSSTNFNLVGSMFGQGTAGVSDTFSNTSLSGSFVFGLQGWADTGFLYSLAGQFTTDGGGNFTYGVADVNDGFHAPVLAGNISTASTGSYYGMMTDGFGSVYLPSGAGILHTFGLYMVDPAINITDPNSTTGGGGALMSNLDGFSGVGVGFAVPQVAGAAFSGNYAFSQEGGYFHGGTTTPGCFDLIGQVYSDVASNLTGTADLNDLINLGQTSGTVTATFTPDQSNPGRSTAKVNLTVGSTFPENVTIYQANSGLLLHVDTDWNPSTNVGTVAFGVLEQQQQQH